jgi:two-component system sensor histidine kinase BaeS
MDTDQALKGLAPLMRRRALSLAGGKEMRASGRFVPFPLFLGGRQIGTMEVRFLLHDRDKVFVHRSGKFLALSFLLMGGVAVLGSFLAARRLTSPIKALARRTRAIVDGDLAEPIPVKSMDEIGKLTLAFNEMAADLQVQESLRRKLISNVAHELRTPLAAMRAELEAMIDDVIPSDGEGIRSLHEETSRLAVILDGIDDLTKAQASPLSLNRSNVDLIPILQNIRDRFQAAARDKGVAIALEGPDRVEAWVDAEKLGQIIVNLVSNAVRAVPDGGVVTLKASQGSKGTLIEVVDNGEGIAENNLPHVFERFYRGKDGGLGLGLSIVKELVDAHGGRIDIESEEGAGTTVRVVLPEERTMARGKEKGEGRRDKE